MAIEDKSEFVLRLIGTTDLLAQQCDLEQGLRKIAEQASLILKTASCSIMLLNTELLEHETPSLHLFAHCGDLPQAAYREIQQFNQGIAGRVAASGKPICVTDIAQSEYITLARRVQAKGSFMSAPIFFEQQVIGVINVNNPVDGRCFGMEELHFLEVFAQFVGKSIHTAQLQNILNSRYLQSTLFNQNEMDQPDDGGCIAPDPVKLEKIVAKSFFQELKKAGFGPNAIIGVAAEIISLLNQRLARHQKRTGR